MNGVDNMRYSLGDEVSFDVIANNGKETKFGCVVGFGKYLDLEYYIVQTKYGNKAKLTEQEVN